jgi:voltage-gated potassium channel
MATPKSGGAPPFRADDIPAEEPPNDGAPIQLRKGHRLDRSTYELFILQVTLLALIVVSTKLFLPFAEEVDQVLTRVDTIICILLLLDFVVRLHYSQHRWRYLFGWGILDLLGSIPVFSVLRFLRLPRMVMQASYLRSDTPAELLADARRNLAQSTLLAVGLLVLLVVTVGSIAVVLVESGNPVANIQTGDDAIWWSIVTVATVGYGDTYPVTTTGRFIGVLMIVVGVGLFSVITSYISSAFVSFGSRQSHDDLAAVQREMAEMRLLLEEMRASQTGTAPNDEGSVRPPPP